jgi:hypothetical protein
VVWAFIALLGSLLALTRFRFGGRARRAWLWCGLALAAVIFCATFALVEAARASYLSIALPYLHGTAPDVDPSQRARIVAEGLSDTHSSTRIAAQALGVLALGALAGATFWVRGPGRALLVSAVFAGLVIGYGVLSRQVALCGGDVAGDWTVNDQLRCLHTLNDDNTRLLMHAKGAVVALNAVLGALAIGFVFRHGAVKSHLPHTHLLAGAFIFVLGASTFAFTRPRAHDTARKPQTQYEGESCSYIRSALPPAHGECEATDGPIVLVSSEATLVDGVPVTAAQLRKVLDSKVSLFRQINPGRHFEGTALLAASPSASPQDLLPWVREIEASDYKRAGAFTALPDRFARTATLGTLRYSRRCCFERVPKDASAEGGTLTRFRTWGEFVASLEASK